MKRLVLLFATFGVLFLGAAAPAFAYDPFNSISGDCTGDVANSAVCQDKNQTGNPISGNDGIIMKITNLIAIITGIAAVIVIVVAGVMYMTAGGDQNAVGTAKNAIVGALIGLLVIALARTIIAFVVSKT